MHLLATITDAQATLSGVIVALCLAILGGMIKAVLQLGRVLQAQGEHSRRLESIEARQHEHDKWHLDRGDR